jgi:DNA-binding NarL/FixJ family response regulator
MSNNKRKIFILEDIPADADMMVEEFSQSGMPFEVHIHSSRHDFIPQLQAFQPSIIIADYSLPGFNALHAFKLLEQEKIDIPFILVSGELSEDIVIEFLKQGIDDYVMKNNLKRLPHAVDAVLKKREIQREKDLALEELRKSEIELKHRAQQLDFLLSRSRLLNTILESTSDFVGISGIDYVSQYINKAGKQMLGIGEGADTSNLKVKDLQPGWAVRYLADEAIPHAIKHGIWRGETALLTLDKIEIPVSQVIIAHKNEKGEVEYFSTIAREIKEATLSNSPKGGE